MSQYDSVRQCAKRDRERIRLAAAYVRHSLPATWNAVSIVALQKFPALPRKNRVRK